MYKIFAVIIIVIVGVNVVLNLKSETSYFKAVEAVEDSVDLKEDTVKEVDKIEKAKADMERISLELDTEESKLLEEKATLEAEYEQEIATRKAEHEAKQAEKDLRLEAITEIRLSF